MRISQLLLLSLLISLNMFGQGFTANLSKLEISTPLTFRVDSVIDARENKEILGYIYNKNTKNYSTVFPANQLDKSLQALLKTRSDSTGEHLILRLNRLFVYQTIKQGKRSLSAEVSLTFIAKQNEKYLERFTSNKTIREDVKFGNKLAVTFLQEALDSCIYIYEKRKTAGKLNNTLLTKEGLTTRYSEDQAPVKNVSYFKRGLFYTFHDLQDYTIDSQTEFEVDLHNLKYNEPREATLVFDERSMRKKEIYAFSNGSSLFIKTGGHYSEITDTAGRFWLNQYPEFTEPIKYNEGMIAMAVVGGIMGVGIYAIIAEKPVGYSKYILDFERGTVVPPDYPEPNKVTSQILFYGSDFLSENDTLTLSVNDARPVKLWRNEYYVYESDYKCTPVVACISLRGNEVCEEITPIILNTAMVRCLTRGDNVKIEELSLSRQQDVKEAIKSGSATRVFQDN